MNIGWIGLGKLGFPCAVTLSLKGHHVIGYDVDESRMVKKANTFREAGPSGIGDFRDWVKKSNIEFGSMSRVVDHSEIIFVAVQTPHDPLYEGITRIPDLRVDFEYKYLIEVISQLAQRIRRPTTVVIISTVLPGTMRKHILPICNEHMNMVYSPLFIAMGTVMHDYLYPEFILMGADNTEGDGVIMLTMFYGTIVNCPFLKMSIESAELSKVAYNTYISFKIGLANLLGEICMKIPGADVDEVIRSIKTSNKRLMSGSYLNSGMGDGGACHPRDNIAMSFLAKKLNLHFDVFDSVMKARERHADWLTSVCSYYCYHYKDDRGRREPLWPFVLGTTFKPGTGIVTGSHALLLMRIMEERLAGEIEGVDPDLESDWEDRVRMAGARLFFIGCKHEAFSKIVFPKGSCVVDPFRYIPDRSEYEVVRIGEKVGIHKPIEVVVTDGINFEDKVI